MYRLIVGIGLALSLMACKTSETDAQTGASTGTKFSLSEFYQWPGEVETDLVFRETAHDASILVVDRSGSMDKGNCGGSGSRLDSVKNAMISFITSAPPELALGMVEFSDDVAFTTAIGTGNRDDLHDRITDMRTISGTYLGNAMNVAVDMLEQYAITQPIGGTYRLIIITDGAANDPNMVKSVANSLTSTHIEVTTVGVCMDDRHVLNNSDLFTYVPASNPQMLVDTLMSTLQAESADFDDSDF